MHSRFLSEHSALLVIDIQERLLGSMRQEPLKRCLHATQTLVELAATVGASIIYTEQYPKGLGPTESGLLELLEEHGADRVEKTTFDACTAPEFHQYLIDLPRDIIVCGMETHICVYSTVRQLIEHRHNVAVPFDAVTSRRHDHFENGLQMMEKAGATITNYETLVFDALHDAKHPEFKRFAKMVQ